MFVSEWLFAVIQTISATNTNCACFCLYAQLRFAYATIVIYVDTYEHNNILQCLRYG